MERMGVFDGGSHAGGRLLATDGLYPSAKGKRVKIANGKVTVIDGPFTESKELVRLLCTVPGVKTMDEAVMWTTRFLEVLGQGECELRPIFDSEDFAPGVFPPEQAARETEWRQGMDKKLTKR